MKGHGEVLVTALHVCRGRPVRAKSKELGSSCSRNRAGPPRRDLRGGRGPYLSIYACCFRSLLSVPVWTINCAATLLIGHIKEFVLRTAGIPGRPDHHSLPPGLPACCSARPGAGACQPEQLPRLFELDDVRRALLGSPWPSGPAPLLPGGPCSPHASFPSSISGGESFSARSQAKHGSWLQVW